MLNPDLAGQNATNRAAAATRADNTRDNVEQVALTNVTAGTYLVRVSHKGTLAGGPGQWVSLLLNGVAAASQPALTLATPVPTATNRVAIAWPSVVGQLYQLQWRTNIASGSWLNLGGELSPTKTNAVVQIQYGTNQPVAFFRVVETE